MNEACSLDTGRGRTLLSSDSIVEWDEKRETRETRSDPWFSLRKDRSCPHFSPTPHHYPGIEPGFYVPPLAHTVEPSTRRAQIPTDTRHGWTWLFLPNDSGIDSREARFKSVFIFNDWIFTAGSAAATHQVLKK